MTAELVPSGLEFGYSIKDVHFCSFLCLTNYVYNCFEKGSWEKFSKLNGFDNFFYESFFAAAKKMHDEMDVCKEKNKFLEDELLKIKWNKPLPESQEIS